MFWGEIMLRKRVLLGSPVKQKEAILKEFLRSLDKLERGELQLDFVFVDDNNEHSLLDHFASKRKNVLIIKADKVEDMYVCDEKTHHWNERLIWKVAAYKNLIIDRAIKGGYDYLFLVDSDLYLHPKTITHLVKQNKDIVSEVFWTKWEPNLAPMPQVWVADQYKLFFARREETLDEEEVKRRMQEFLDMLKKPGIYKVGGLGACTLISRNALLKGVSFSEIYNLSLWGEDRHFCVRAVALGLELYADTHFPPFHIYRESDLEELKNYKRKMGLVKEKKQGTNSKRGKGDKITLAMLVRNEAGRFLKQVISNARQYIHNAVILDDASEDDTIEVCRETLEGIPLTIASNPTSGFANEINLRKKLWQMAIDTQPDWILILDADELFEASAPPILKKLAQNTDVYWYAFRLFDMWTETHYREDRYWCAHQFYRPFMVRYVPGYNYQWHESPLHCGRFPINIGNFKGENHFLRIKHLGWIRPEDRLAKYYRYKKLDPGCRYGIAEQYESILDPSPNLVKWEEI